MRKLLGSNDYRDMPWKNGGGVTRELLRIPHPTDPERFLARLSIATVAESGLFSVFPGIDRTILLLEGRGMALTVGERAEVTLDQRWEPFAFSGDETTACRLLGGAIRDFNLMVDRAVARAKLSVVELSAGGRQRVTAAAAAEIVLFYGLSGSSKVGEQALTAQETLWLEGASGALDIVAEDGAAMVVVSITRRS